MVIVVDLEALASHCCGFKSHQELGIQLAYGTLLFLLGYPLVPEIMRGGAPGVVLHCKAGKLPYNLYMCRCDLKPNQKKITLGI